MDFIEGVGPGARWSDHWVYDELRSPITAGFAQARLIEPLQARVPISFDDVLPGCYEQRSRLRDMDDNGVEASLCFPTFPRFCGQTFLERRDKELALLCVQAYNDWMIDEWCAGAGCGRLIPLTLVPLWDAELAATEVRRCAAKGSHAIAFSECPPYLGLPSIHSGRWDPLWAVCEETETVVNMHIGSSSKLTTTSADAPLSVVMTLNAHNAMSAVTDWLLSGTLARFSTLRIALSEGQVGWMPFILERLDRVWERGPVFDTDMFARVPERPSTYVPNRVYGCIFDDVHGLNSRDIIGMSQIMFEVDYPHADSSFPHSLETARRLIREAGLDDEESQQFLRGNAIACYQLERFGITR
jgi:predicted TIM-barrel fold metal-dependent hydrolase